MSIPVICDRCRSTGFAGEGDFSHLGDLLEFTPVPRKKRVNGWDPDAQRAFIALLATTGSKRQSALAIGRNAHGIDQLLKAAHSASFKAAYERALAIHARHGSIKLAQGVADAAARNAQLTPPSRLRDLPAPLDGEGEEPNLTEDERWQLLERIGLKLQRKVAQERSARLAGEIVAADFYLRQITMNEIILDLTAAELGVSPYEVLRELRRGGHGPLAIAATEFSDWLDRSRREWWAREGDPERPPHPDARYLERHRSDEGAYATEAELYPSHGVRPPPGVSVEQWQAMDKAEQQAVIDRVRREDAEAQREWESRARSDWEARQSDSPPL